MNLKGQYEKADERSVGEFRNTRAATQIWTFQHDIKQWLFFSKGSDINPKKFPGWDLDGFLIDVKTEKNKNTSSQHVITLIFDKRNGLDKFWSEFLFISSYCPTEVDFMRGDSWKPNIEPMIKTSGAYSVLEVINPLTGEMEYESKKFYKKNAKKMYEEDPEFHKWFDIAVDYSCKERISNGLLKINVSKFEDNNDKGGDPMEDLSSLILEEVPTAENEVSTKEEPKKRGRKKKTEEVMAPKADDDFISESQIIEE